MGPASEQSLPLKTGTKQRVGVGRETENYFAFSIEWKKKKRDSN